MQPLHKRWALIFSWALRSSIKPIWAEPERKSRSEGTSSMATAKASMMPCSKSGRPIPGDDTFMGKISRRNLPKLVSEGLGVSPQMKTVALKSKRLSRDECQGQEDFHKRHTLLSPCLRAVC